MMVFLPCPVCSFVHTTQTLCLHCCHLDAVDVQRLVEIDDLGARQRGLQRRIRREWACPVPATSKQSGLEYPATVGGPRRNTSELGCDRVYNQRWEGPAARLQVGRGVQPLVDAAARHVDEVAQQHPDDGLRGVRHQDAPLQAHNWVEW